MGLFKFLKPDGSKKGIARWGNSRGGSSEPEPEPQLNSIICGTSEAGDAIGFHDGDTDSYGYQNNVTIDGFGVIQVRALGDHIRIHLAGNEATAENINVNIAGSEYVFALEVGQPRYELVDPALAELFVDGAELLVIDGQDTIEPSDETKPAGKAPKNVKKKK